MVIYGVKNLSVVGLACSLQRAFIKEQCNCCCCMSQWISDDTRHLQWKSLTSTYLCLSQRPCLHHVLCCCHRKTNMLDEDRPSSQKASVLCLDMAKMQTEKNRDRLSRECASRFVDTCEPLIRRP